MIVIDEQISDEELRRGFDWYPGRVAFVRELRPASIIKDDAVPKLLAQAKQPTFLTINFVHFGRRALIDRRFCIICFTLSPLQAWAIPHLTRNLFHSTSFRTKADRMGKVILVRPRRISYFEAGHLRIRHLPRS